MMEVTMCPVAETKHENKIYSLSRKNNLPRIQINPKIVLSKDRNNFFNELYIALYFALYLLVWIMGNKI